MGKYVDPMKELGNRAGLFTTGGFELDLSGLSSIKARLQINAADELTVVMPAQILDGLWRSDMPVWQVGANLVLKMGYNGDLDLIQEFEVVSTTVEYGADGEEEMTVRGVSDLARAARNKNHRAFKGDDKSVIDEICASYGWTNGVTGELAKSTARLKENGKSDLELLKRIAKEAVLGGPRLTRDKVLLMPSPGVGDLKFARGIPTKSGEHRRLHSIQVNREGGAMTTRVAIVGWDPEKKEFVETDFEADEFGGDPKIVYEGKPSTKALKDEATTQGLVLAVIEHKGQNKSDRVDVLSSGKYLNETDAVDLARRWFILREKLSRWSNVTVDGNADLLPYTSFEIDGNLANMDKGTWLPITIEHVVDQGGWRCECRSIRVVDEAVITPVDPGGFVSGAKPKKNGR